MTDAPKEVWLIWEGGLVTAWDDEKSPSRKAKHYMRVEPCPHCTGEWGVNPNCKECRGKGWVIK